MDPTPEPDGPAHAAPATSPPATPVSPPRPAPRPGPRGKLATARAVRREDVAARRLQGALLARLPLLVSAVLVLGLGLWFGQPALLRLAARRLPGTAPGDWATARLAALRDPHSFDIYVRELGRPDVDRTLASYLVFCLAGRATVAPEGEQPPDDPLALARHREVLADGLRSADPVVRRGTLYALCWLKDRAWVQDPTLLLAAGDGLTSDDVATRRYAAMALRSNPATPALRRMLARALETDPDSDVRKNAARGLGLAGHDPEHRGALTAALGDPVADVRREAALALARAGAVPSLDELERLLAQEEPQKRAELLAAVDRHAGARATQVLVRALREEAPGVRRAAVAALGGREGDEARAGVELALRDADPGVRVAAAAALSTRLDGRDAVPALVAALPGHAGWSELSELHEALRTLTGAEIPGPGPDRESWARVVGAWERWLAERGRRSP